VPTGLHSRRVEQQCFERVAYIPYRWRNPFDDGLKDFFHSHALQTLGQSCFRYRTRAHTVFADIWIISAGSNPNVACIWSATSSGCAAGMSIYQDFPVRFTPSHRCVTTNLVQDGDDLQAAFLRNMEDGDGLGLYALRRVHEQ
jgi:hypothetical protein